MANLNFGQRLERYIFLYNLDRHQKGKRLCYGDNLEINEYLLNQAIERMSEGRNKHTPRNCEISIQNVCMEAKIKPQNVYRSSCYLGELREKIRHQEMLRRKGLMKQALCDFLANIDAYTDIYGFRLSIQYLMKQAGLSKDQYYALTIPLDDLHQELKDAQAALRKSKAKRKAAA